MANYRYWLGVFSSFLLFSLVFFSQKSVVNHYSAAGHQGEFGLLLFVIPGLIASYLSIKKCILCPLLGALIALPLCLIIRHFGLLPGYSLWQELAYAVSAVVWCVLGAMLYLFIRMISQTLEQLRQRKRQ
ncbi:hypothetical protein C9426_35395 [Serratia sp. S1B]|nr:hypothetical protein C9426_35395 [Serratia sp. S1B]